MKINTLILLLPALLFGISVRQDSPAFDKVGYNNCNMQKNGEAIIIKEFVRPGMVVFDVGANTGDWSKIALTKAPKKIYAFEPIPKSYQQLCVNLQADRRPAVSCFQLALSHIDGQATFCYYDTFDRLSSFYHRPVVEKMHKVEPIQLTVTTRGLDSFCKELGIEAIDVLKIDTEGAELAVLKGAESMLEQQRIQVIQFEYGGTYPDAGITLKEVYGLLRECGYEIFRIIPTGLLHIPVWREALENKQYSNYVALTPAASREYLG